MGVAKGIFAGITSTTIGIKRKWDIAFGRVDVIRVTVLKYTPRCKTFTSEVSTET